MMISTAQAAELLGISATRVRFLLSKGRVKGAYKVGRTWVIPLFDGMPVVTPGTRGPKRNWSKRTNYTKAVIHVNQKVIRQNHNTGERNPVITVKRGSKNTYGHTVEVNGPCRVMYRPDEPLKCGARVWIETISDFKVIA
ncbi:MAG: helix-turn-helix domain-containing protein [Moorea sp. SIO4G2]|uniref:helix-turn-helix domain-containing protein n=1 Tax=unclassified Moorena TaxID=2683338 RepID=UPI0013FCDCBE|nr:MULTISPECIES: helix-turn-helix domain-containing protein [unclassified Moorena]NEO13553.1 helix-turn-helix domain-containing protein [Moorena sp. SIO3E8]NEO59644.1 helix-turn-helix domain-containing protein [Moorena sp. SIO4G2]NEP98548.1 helix-turn-helix domain-containing protein [Moorena sp. SIO3F7]